MKIRIDEAGAKNDGEFFFDLQCLNRKVAAAHIRHRLVCNKKVDFGSMFMYVAQRIHTARHPSECIAECPKHITNHFNKHRFIIDKEYSFCAGELILIDVIVLDGSRFHGRWQIDPHRSAFPRLAHGLQTATMRLYYAEHNA